MRDFLLSTFQMCAAPYTAEDKSNGPETFMEEIQHQLGRGFWELMICAGVGSDFAVIMCLPNPFAVENTIKIERRESTLSTEKRIKRFLKHFQSCAQDAHVRVTHGGQNNMAQIFFDPKDMLYSLMELRAKKYPEEMHAIRHLNFARHLMERLENYVPAHQLH